MKCQLCLHTGARTVTREQVEAVVTPTRTRSWVPISHSRLLAGVQLELARAGLTVIEESHGLTREGSRYFGLMQVSGSDDANDFALVVGLRNSHDKSFPAGLALGAS